MTNKRTDPPTGMQKVGEGQDTAWMTQFQGTETEKGFAAMKEYRILPRVKVVQAMSDQSLKKSFGEGSVIIAPGNAKVCGEGQSFEFVPVFFYAEALKLADRQDKTQFFIVQRSTDRASELFKKARDPEKWEEGYGTPDQKTGEFPMHYRYVEVLNFPGFIANADNELKGTAMVLAFQRGEFSKGKALTNGIMMRRANGQVVPIWMQRWLFKPVFREKGDKRWWGIDFENPPKPFIDHEDLEFYQTQHNELEKFFKEGLLSADYSDEEGVREAGATGEGDNPDM